MTTVFDDPIRLLRQLKGAPLAVLIAMNLVRARVTADWLATVTGYTDKPVTQALKLLEAYRWIARVQGGWQITQGVQLPLMGHYETMENLQESTESEKFRSSSNSRDGLTLLEELTPLLGDRKNSDSFRDNYRALKINGIREPALSRLAALEHVNPDYIVAHVRQVRLERGNLGMAVHRIEMNWEKPEVEEPVDPKQRWSGGVFAEYFSESSDESEEP